MNDECGCPGSCEEHRKDGPGLAEVLRFTGATYRRLDYWVRVGYLVPDDASPGSGTYRKWPIEELRVAREMAFLVGVGLLPDAAHRAARSGGVLAPGVRVVIDELSKDEQCPEAA